MSDRRTYVWAFEADSVGALEKLINAEIEETKGEVDELSHHRGRRQALRPGELQAAQGQALAS